MEKSNELIVVGKNEIIPETKRADRQRPPDTPEDHKVVVEGMIQSMTIEQEMLYAGRVQAYAGRAKSTMTVVECHSGVYMENLPVPMVLVKGRNVAVDGRTSRVRVTVEWLPPEGKLPT